MNINNHFARLPDEMLITIYNFTPNSKPMLCKVNRRWRALLLNKPINQENVWHAAINDGFRVNLGEIAAAKIKRYVFDNHDLLTRADFTWRCCGSDGTELDILFLDGIFTECWRQLEDDKYPHLTGYNSHAKCRFIEELFTRIVSKCSSRDSTKIMKMVVCMGNEGVVKSALECGFPIDDNIMKYVTRLDVMILLRKNGCGWPTDILLYILTYFTGMNVIDGTLDEAYMKMFEYVIQNGYTITDNDFIFTARIKLAWALSLMLNNGYVIHEKLLTDCGLPEFTVEFIRQFMK